jgi:hypothetical protein
MSSIRRVFYYIVSIVTLSVMSAGAGTLLYLVLNPAITGDMSKLPPNFVGHQLSLGLAELIIGAPLWFLFWRSIQRQVHDNATEIGAAARHIYLNLIFLVTAITSLFMASDLLKWLIGGAHRSENAAGSLATLIVLACLWLYHWRTTDKDGRPSPVSRTLRRWYIYVVSAWGLIWLIVGAVQLIYASASYISGGSSVLIRGSFWTDNARTFATWILLGGLWWGHHWFRLSKGDIDSTLRQVYIYLLTIVGGSVAGLVALVITIQRLLILALQTDGFSNPDYFQFLGWTVPLMVIAIGIVAYHQNVSQEEAGQVQERRLSSRRVHLYILSFLGLASLVAGLLILLGLVLNLPLSQSAAGWWRSQLAQGIALVIVAVPLFSYYWSRVAILAFKGGLVEWKARSRRIYFYLIIVASILGLVGGMVYLIYQILNAALTSGINMEVYRATIRGFQAVVVSTPFFIYHWRQVRAEQKKGAEAGVGPKTVSLLGDSHSQQLVQLLEEKLGHKVHFLQSAGTESESKMWSQEEVSQVLQDIAASPLSRIMIVVSEGKIMVLSYQEKY